MRVLLGDCFCCSKAKTPEGKKRGMNLGGDDDFKLENRTENSMNCSPCLSSGWSFSGADLANTTMANSSGKEDLILPSCSSASMVDSFGPNFNGGYFDVYNNFSSSNLVGISRDSAASLRRSVDTTLDMCWNPPNQMVKEINSSTLIPPSLPQFPADSAFIERAARLSCFNGGNLMETASHFSISQPIALYSRSLVIPGNQELTAINGIRSDTIDEVSVDVYLEDGTNSPKNEKQNENQLGLHKEEKQCIGELENEMSGSGQDEPSMGEGRCKESSGNKKRKRSRQRNELDPAREAAQKAGESARDDDEIQCNNDQNPCPVNEKCTGKHGSQASGPHKEEYIHVRARRGQATNSHSLAERVRREKISERMKFLQDLVPGCSKVTGKAVMLDEIINYVQSLQRQVEFLSMKLATVNPRMDFRSDGFEKDILKTRAGPSSSLGYSPDISMAYPPPLQLSQQGLLSWGVNGMRGPSEILRRTLASQLTPLTGGFKEPSQLSNLWEEDLQNVIQTSFGTAAPSNNQIVDGSLPPGDMKVEL